MEFGGASLTKTMEGSILEGTIKITIQKTTKISIARYLNIMQQHLEGKLAESIKFMDIPNETEVYKGKIKHTIGTN